MTDTLTLCDVCEAVRADSRVGIWCCGFWFCCESCWAHHDSVDGHARATAGGA